MSETTDYLRTCTCGARYEPPLRTTPIGCRKCRGLVCPLCSGPTLDNRVCPRDDCQEVLLKAHKAALFEDRKRQKAEPELRLVERRTA